MSPVALKPEGTRARLGRVVLQSRGVSGRATATEIPIATARGLVGATADLDAALERHGFRVTDAVEIAQPRDFGPRRAGEPGAVEPTVQIEVPPPAEGFGQVVLSTSEADVMTWHFPEPKVGARDLAPTGNVYAIPRLGGQAQAPVARGLVAALGKHILKVLTFPLIEEGVGRIGEAFAARWEQARRRARVRTFTTADHAAFEATEIVGDAWSPLSEGPCALFVHGTFSLTHTAFGALPADFVEEVHRVYDGRVLAYDHPTLSVDPAENARWLLQQVPPGARLEVDIVAHSRGGLVGRSLVPLPGNGDELADRIRVRKLISVAAPNAGTVLADPANLKEFVDTHTNILNFFPSVGAVDVLEGIITVVKLVAAGVLGGLPGLQSMVPEGDFLADLNVSGAGPKTHFALASDFEPKSESGLIAFKDRVVDALFKAANDLTVPAESVYEHNGAMGFPIRDRVVFPPGDSVHHSGFFEHRPAVDQLLAWLAR